MILNSKEIGIYEGWKIYCSSNDKNAKIQYIAYLQENIRKAPLMLNCDNLEGLKRMIEKQPRRKVAY